MRQSGKTCSTRPRTVSGMQRLAAFQRQWLTRLQRRRVAPSVRSQGASFASIFCKILRGSDLDQCTVQLNGRAGSQRIVPAKPRITPKICHRTDSRFRNENYFAHDTPALESSFVPEPLARNLPKGCLGAGNRSVEGVKGVGDQKQVDIAVVPRFTQPEKFFRPTRRQHPGLDSSAGVPRAL